MKKIFGFILILSGLPLVGYGANGGDVRLNEFLSQPSSGVSWVELINPSGFTVNLSGWSISHLITDGLGSTTVATTTLPGLTIPAGGLVSFDFSIGTSSDKLILLDDLNSIIYGVVYGNINDVDYGRYDSLGTSPAVGQSAYSLGSGGGGPWMLTDSPTRNWFNQAPSKHEILDSLPAEISTNLSTSTDWTALGDIILSRVGFDSDVWPGPHNLTGITERDELLRRANELAASSTATTSPDLTPPPAQAPVVSRGGGGGGSSYSVPVLPIIASTTATSTGLVFGVKTFRFSRMLRPGMRGSDVQELQKLLQTAGFFKVSPTNYFGPATKQALTLWQKKNKIRPATGVVGRPTLKFLNNLAS